MKRPLLALGIALALALSPGPGGPARAASYDPDLTWRTLVTDHFRITFHGGEEQLAEEFAAAMELAWDEVSAELKTAPKRRVEMVLVDNTDSANGYAMTVPVNTIVIFVTAPTEGSTLSTYDHWPETIGTHELTHILHIDTVEGLPGFVRAVLGRVVSVNRVSPGWVVEGFATFQETRLTTTGRGRSTYVHMVKRMSVLEDAFPPLGNLDGFQSDPPGGNLRYLFGQDFIQYIADRTGRDVWTDWVHGYGRGIPYLLPGRRIFGMPIQRLYREWRDAMTERYQAQAAEIEAQGLTPFRLLSDGVDECAGPTWSPEGRRIVWACSDPNTGTDVLLADHAGQDAEVELRHRGASHFTWRIDGKAFAYSSSRVVNRFNVWQDVTLHRIGGRTETLTSGDRARDPDLAPDGRTLVVVTNAVQDNQLQRLTIDGRLEPLTEYTDHTQLSTPRISPDGRWLALSRWSDGRRELWVYTADGEPYRRLTVDAASDIDPAWSPDGRTLYFSSDRTGVFNLYAVDLETERLWQVSNVLGGAFHPSPHPWGHGIAFESFSNNGPDIAWMDLDRSQWRDRGTLPLPLDHAGPLAAVLPEDGDVLVATRLRNARLAREEIEAQAAPAPAAPSPALPAEPAPAEPAPDVQGPDEPAPRTPAAPAPGWLTESLPYPGLDGLGGAFLDARRWGGTWGVPEEPPLGDPALAGLPRVSDQPESGPDEQEATEVVTEAPEEEDYPFTWPVQRYSPWGTLLPPRYLLPRIYQTSFGYMGALSTSGTDTLRRYLYSGYVSYRTDSRYLGWGASFALNTWVPIITVGAYSYTTPYGDIYETTQPPAEGGAWVPSVQSTNTRYWDKRIRGYAQVSYAIDEYRSVFGRWTGTSRQPLDPVGPDVYRPFLPTRGFQSSIGGGWRYARGRFHDKSISPESARVFSILGEVQDPLIGSTVLDDNDQPVGFTQLQVTADWREYRTLPWAHNHVLAMKLAGGVSAGDENRYGSFRLGGAFGESAYYTLPDEWRALRGFPAATVSGESYYLGALEYRLPLWRPERGFGTLPFFARWLSASAFVDFGNAFSDPTEESVLADVRVGTGAELVGTAIIGWGIPVTLRLGYAFAALGEGGYAPGDLDGLYWWFGTSF